MTLENAPAAPALSPARFPWRRIAVLFAAIFVAVVAVLAVVGNGSIGRGASVAQVWLIGPQDDTYRIVAVHDRDDDDSSFFNGAMMAIDRINGELGGILGRPVVLELAVEPLVTQRKPLERVVKETLTLADGIVVKKDLLAVIGHTGSNAAITASAVYDRNQVLYLSTHATETSFTNHSLDTVFALVPNNAANAQMLAQYAHLNGLKRFVLLSDKSEYGRETTKFFKEAAAYLDGDIVYRSHLGDSSRSIGQLLLYILDNTGFGPEDFDAFFVVTSDPLETARFIRQARDLGLKMPILGMEYLYSDLMVTAVGNEAMNDVIGVSVFDAEPASDAAKEFAAAYQTINRRLPDLEAALGYDAVMLVHDAIARNGNTNGRDLADTIKVSRFKDPFVGVTGPLLFDINGAIVDTDAYIVRHDGRNFHTVKSFSIPLPDDMVPQIGRR